MFRVQVLKLSHGSTKVRYGSLRMGSKLSTRWIIVSYFTMAGALLPAIIALFAVTSHSDVGRYGVFAMASIGGGFFAARSSRQRTVAEGAVAGVVLAASMLLLMFLSLDPSRYSYRINVEALSIPLSLVLVTFAGALFGGNLGERWVPGPRFAQARWVCLSALHCAGACMACWCAAAVVMDLTDNRLATFLLVLSVIAAPAIGGIVTQMASPQPAATPIMQGSLAWTVVGGLTALTTTAHVGAVIVTVIVTLIVAVVICSVGAVGAALAWRLGWQLPANEPVNLAKARTRT